MFTEATYYSFIVVRTIYDIGYIASSKMSVVVIISMHVNNRASYSKF